MGKKQSYKGDALEKALIEDYEALHDEEEKEIEAFLRNLNSSKEVLPKESKFDPLPQESVVDPPIVELKRLPSQVCLP